MTIAEGYALLGGDLIETLSRLGDQALLMKHLRQFPEDDGMPRLRHAIAAGARDAVWQAAHALRGACQTLGFSRLAETVGQFMAAPDMQWAELERAHAHTVAVIGLMEENDEELTVLARMLRGSATPSDAAEEREDIVEGIRRFDGLRALLAEDDHLSAEVSAELLAGLGLQTRVAHDGVEAVRLAQEGGFDCVFLDAHMPGRDGAAVFGDICLALPHAPVFALTAGVSREEEQRLLSAGMRACLLKPVGAQQIARLLSAYFPDR